MAMWHAYRSHRRRLRRYLGADNAQTRVLKVLVLLVESGSVYSIILVSGTPNTFSKTERVADTLADPRRRTTAPKASNKFRSRHLFSVRMPGPPCGNYSHHTLRLISGPKADTSGFQAMYPTVIIVLTAANSSPLDHGLSQISAGSDDSGPPGRWRQRVPPTAVRLRRCTRCTYEESPNGKVTIGSWQQESVEESREMEAPSVPKRRQDSIVDIV